MGKGLWGAVFLLVSAVAGAQGPAPRQFGAGVVLGMPTGLSAKYWLDGWRAVEFGMGSAAGAVVSGAGLTWHEPQALSIPGVSNALYLHLGARAGNRESGVRGLAGATVYPARVPVELFFELGPYLDLDAGEAQLDVGLGARWYFIGR